MYINRTVTSTTYDTTMIVMIKKNTKLLCDYLLNVCNLEFRKMFPSCSK